MKFGIYLYHPLEEAYRVARLAEKSGFHSVWMGDHLDGKTPWLEAWTTLAAISIKTKRVKIGVGVTDPFRRNPAVLAQTAATLDVVSNGRLIFGIGPGEAMNLKPYGMVMQEPVSRMIETVRIVKKLWTEEWVSYRGKFHRLSKATLKPKPIQSPHPPIWIAANSPRTMRFTAEVGDGWLPHRVSPSIYATEWEQIRHRAKLVGRNTDEIEGGLYVQSAISREYDSNKSKYRQIERDARSYLLYTPKRLEQMKYNVPTYEFDFARFIFSKERMRVLLKKADEIPIDAVKQCGLFGKPEECANRLEQYAKAGVEHLIVNLLNLKEDKAGAIRLYGRLFSRFT